VKAQKIRCREVGAINDENGNIRKKAVQAICCRTTLSTRKKSGRRNPQGNLRLKNRKNLRKRSHAPRCWKKGELAVLLSEEDRRTNGGCKTEDSWARKELRHDITSWKEEVPYEALRTTP